MSMKKRAVVLLVGVLGAVGLVAWSLLPSNGVKAKAERGGSAVLSVRREPVTSSGSRAPLPPKTQLTRVQARLLISSIEASVSDGKLHVFCPVQWPDGGPVNDGHYSVVESLFQFSDGVYEGRRVLKSQGSSEALYIRWTALEGQTEVQCEATAMGRASLTLNGVDPNGEVVPLYNVAGCGQSAMGAFSDNGEVGNTFEVLTYPEECSLYVVPAAEGLQAKRVPVAPMEVGSSRAQNVRFDWAKPEEKISLASVVKVERDLYGEMIVDGTAFVAALEEELEGTSGVYQAELTSKLAEVRAKIEVAKRGVEFDKRLKEINETLLAVSQELAELEEGSGDDKERAVQELVSELDELNAELLGLRQERLTTAR